MSSKIVSTSLSNSPTTPVESKFADCSNNPEDYGDISIVKLISKAKFPVYLADSPAKKQQFALKVFGFDGGQPHPYYRNEARFATLIHPHVIRTVYAEEETSISSKGKDNQVSCILMEYAPYGDFFDFVKKFKKDLTDKLVRTYFRQLVEGIEYIHNSGVCHLDLKLENLLLGDDYLMKIADFDLSYVVGDSTVLTRGTKFYRAPELRASKCKNGVAADIYAAGIILFVMKCGGVIPHTEDKLYQGINLFELLSTNPQEFFRNHITIQKREASFFDEDFTKLFVAMVQPDAEKRATLRQVKNSRWYNGPVYSKKELKDVVKGLFGH